MTKPTGNPRGRPTFKPTAKNRSDVAVWKAGGMSDDSIALALSIDSDTMKKHFKEEIHSGWAKKRSLVISAQFKAAINGNVSAQKLFLETSNRVSAESSFENRQPEGRRQRVIPIGKKEAEADAARTAGVGTEWGTDLLAKPTSIQ